MIILLMVALVQANVFLEFSKANSLQEIEQGLKNLYINDNYTFPGDDLMPSNLGSLPLLLNDSQDCLQHLKNNNSVFELPCDVLAILKNKGNQDKIPDLCNRQTILENG